MCISVIFVCLFDLTSVYPKVILDMYGLVGRGMLCMCSSMCMRICTCLKYMEASQVCVRARVRTLDGFSDLGLSAKPNNLGG